MSEEDLSLGQEQERLARELFEVMRKGKDQIIHKNDTWEHSLNDNGRKGFIDIAEWIINDRKRICEPLVRWRKADPYTKEGKYPEDAISETLKLAGEEV